MCRAVAQSQGDTGFELAKVPVRHGLMQPPTMASCDVIVSLCVVPQAELCERNLISRIFVSKRDSALLDTF